MYCTINFSYSSVPYDDRKTYIERLKKLADAWRDENSPDYLVRAISNFFGGNLNEFRKILRELAKRGCVVFEYDSGRYLFNSNRHRGF